jgi:uncharacterized protein YggE
MRFLPLAALAALCLSVPALAQQQNDGAAPRPATISVNGSGEAQLKPDFARIVVTVGTRADTVGQAVESNRTASERVLARIQSLGVKREDIRTANFQVFETPTRVDREGREIKAPRFTAEHQLRLVTRDIEGVGKLSGELLASGDMTFQSLSWGLDRQEEGEDQARRNAVRDARRQAEVFADAAGVRLGRLFEVRDGSVRPYHPEADMPMRMSAAKAAEALPIVPPATVRYTANVQMVWEVVPQ